MNKSNLVVIIYIIGIIFGALFLDIWGAETSLPKAMAVVAWTALFAICFIYIDKNDTEKK
tara:strand:- start:78 stop:257 length:180 start_codon:yes stop_codon:yes gene_type:complete